MFNSPEIPSDGPLFHNLGAGFESPDHIKLRVGHSPLGIVQVKNLSEDQVVAISLAAGFKLPEQIFRQSLDALSAQDFCSLKMLAVCGNIFHGYAVREQISFLNYRGKVSRKQSLAFICLGSNKKQPGELEKADFTLEIEKSSDSQNNDLFESNSARFNIRLSFENCSMPASRAVAIAQHKAVVDLLAKLRTMELAGPEWCWHSYLAPKEGFTAVHHGRAQLLFDELSFEDYSVYQEPKHALSKIVLVPSISVLGEIARRSGIPWENQAMRVIQRLLDSPEQAIEHMEYELIAPSKRPIKVWKTIRQECSLDGKLCPSVIIGYTDPFNKIGACKVIVSNISPVEQASKKQSDKKLKPSFYAEFNWNIPKELGQKVIGFLVKDLKKRKLLVEEPEDWSPTLW